MRRPKPLRTGDIVRLIALGYGEPTGDCVVISDQAGAMVWFRSDEPSSQYRGLAFVARRSAVRVIQRQISPQPVPDQREFGPDDE